MPFRLFSTPDQGDFVALAETLTCRHFRRVADAMTDWAERIGAPPPPLDVDSLTPERLSTGLWGPGSGQVLRALGSGRDEAFPWASAQLLVAAVTADAIDELELDLACPDWLAVAGASVRGERIRIRAAAGRLVVSSPADDRLLELARHDLGEVSVWARAEADVVRLGSAAAATLADAAHVDQWDPTGCPTGVNSVAFRVAIEEASAALESALPRTYVWIAALLREVTALADPGLGTRSSSSILWPGHARMSNGASLVQAITMLVHECCHQYYYLTQCFAPTAAPQAPEVHSVLKGTRRPLERVLLGFHAFGNVLLVQEALVADRHLVGAGVERELAATRRAVVGLDDALAPWWETHLEQAGKDLYLPLRARLVEAGLLAGAARAAG